MFRYCFFPHLTGGEADDRPPVLVVKDKQTEALQEIVAGIEDEMGDEALTPEEQEYLKNYSDPNNTCPVCPHWR